MISVANHARPYFAQGSVVMTMWASDLEGLYEVAQSTQRHGGDWLASPETVREIWRERSPHSYAFSSSFVGDTLWSRRVRIVAPRLVADGRIERDALLW